MSLPPIVLRGARQHNLRSIDLDLPRGQLVCVAGPSGSGKSSLAFATIHAEGVRRYLDHLRSSRAAGEALERMLQALPRPEVDALHGLPPTVGIGQGRPPLTTLETVGTATELSAQLRQLFARFGQPHCPTCERPLQALPIPKQVEEVLGTFPQGAAVTVLAPLAPLEHAELEGELERLRKAGWARVRLDGEVLALDEALVPTRAGERSVEVLVDRLVLREGEGTARRLSEALRHACELGSGRALVEASSKEGALGALSLTERAICPSCAYHAPPLSPELFSWRTRKGACPECAGRGLALSIDLGRVVSDPNLSLLQGALGAWGGEGTLANALLVSELVSCLGVDPGTPWKELPEQQRQAILCGSGEAHTSAPEAGSTGRRAKKGVGLRKSSGATWEGVLVRLERMLASQGSSAAASALGTPSALEREPEEEPSAEDLAPLLQERPCPRCKGARLQEGALCVRLLGQTYPQLEGLPLRDLRARLTPEAFAGTALQGAGRARAAPLLEPLMARLSSLDELGLGHVPASRSLASLSSGELQRLRIGLQRTAALTHVLYVLDEPTAGLHPSDVERLCTSLEALLQAEHSLLVVEHDRTLLERAHHIVELGPGAGEEGGRLLAQGSPTALQALATPLGAWLRGQRLPARRGEPKRPRERWLRLQGARRKNLHAPTLEIPLGCLCAVTGVSGSGKSALVMEALLPALHARLAGRSDVDVDAERGVLGGLEGLEALVALDHRPLTRSPRASPASVMGLLEPLRELFASLPEARARGYKPSRFSHNVKGGRCEVCQGTGEQGLGGALLAELRTTCEVCEGTRFERETLEVRYKGLDIAQVLDLSVTQARELFDAIPRLRTRLDALERAGMGYVRLGQSASTLSGGEAQRVRLAQHLGREVAPRTLYLLDEPTTGLGFSDVESLLTILFELRDRGATLLVIEHDPDFVALCDWVVDLGPGAGPEGGRIVATGTPMEVAQHPASRTGPWLRAALERRGGA